MANYYRSNKNEVKHFPLLKQIIKEKQTFHFQFGHNDSKFVPELSWWQGKLVSPGIQTQASSGT